MEKLYSPKTLQRIRSKYNFKPQKSLGQNFLIDGNILEKIVDGAEVNKGDLVIEIGPGIGALTAKIAKKAAFVVAVEIDRNLMPVLSETLAPYANVQIVHGDIMKSDLRDIVATAQAKNDMQFDSIKVLGNLPYYITTAVLMMLLECAWDLLDSITVMMQKEVADRILALPRTKEYGALSIAVQYYCTIERVLLASKEVFWPSPKVDSTVLRLNIRRNKAVELADENIFFEIVRAGFGQRRKTLLNSLSSIDRFSKDEINKILFASGIDPNRRAETLNIVEFAKLANKFEKQQRQEGSVK